jgi:Bax protein
MLKELLRRVDIVPPSLALTQAALESGWGTSRFAQEGNALFGQKAFNDSVDSLLSRHKKPADVHRYRSYDSLMSAVRSYVHNLNSHPAYGEFRSQRAELRKKAGDGPLDGDNLARTLLRYSERGLSYTADIRQMMRSNGMRSYDAARLEATGTQFASRSPSGA